MAFEIAVEHQLTDESRVYEEFEGVVSFDDPPTTEKMHIDFADDRETVAVLGAKVVSAKQK
jgi:hypothetical protein